MIKKFSLALCALLLTYFGVAQEVEFTEYDLDNGLHVILHQDNSAPVVSVGVMYHVGGKDEEPGRSGFAHFFEHLLFEGTENIERGKWFSIVSAHGGQNNANTTQDRTYYYETFPSNNLELGLWMESERMYHPVIGQKGVDTQREVVKEEKRSRMDNAPYGKIAYGGAVEPSLFKKHPYKSTVIGSMEDLDAAKLEEFEAFFDKYYVPNNAVLVVTGDIDKAETKSLIEKYFGSIERGADVERVNVKEDPVEGPIKITEYDNNIQIPLKVYAYRTPAVKDHDTYVLDMISTILTSGKSSRMHKRMVEEDKSALQVLAFNRSEEDYGTYIIGALPMGGNDLDIVSETMDEEIEKLKNELISEKEYEKLQNTLESRFVSMNDNQEGIAHSLASYYTLYGGQTDLINKELEIYKKITREEIKEVANKYLNKNERVELDYLPGSDEEN